MGQVFWRSTNVDDETEAFVVGIGNESSQCANYVISRMSIIKFAEL